MNENYVRIFDTTLRDGEQSPGATLTSAEKLEISRSLARLGVDVIEAGFPAASPDDLEAVRQIALEVGKRLPGAERFAELNPRIPAICGLARANRNDIDAAWEAVKHADRPRIHTFLATSPIHMRYKLHMDPEEVVERVREMVAYAARCAKMSNFLRKMPVAASPSSSTWFWVKRSKPAQRRSISPIPWAIPRPMNLDA